MRLSQLRWLVLAMPLCLSGVANAAPSSLFARGFAAVPAPQQVTLTEAEFEFGPAWRTETAGVNANDVAVTTLSEEMTARHHLGTPTAKGSSLVRLVVSKGSVVPGQALDRDKELLAKQAYRLKLTQKQITIEANDPQGLFYGVETLAQLLKHSGNRLILPEGEITDWPDLQMRNLYWDDAHHLERPEALKRAVRQAAFFKVNGFVLKLEGHFQYKHAPEIVEPYALTPEELQDITNYGLRYHVQVVPYLDAPAHVAFLLKHPAYKKLRAFPDSNYEICATNPDAIKLLQGMFQDLIDASKGVDYFYLSTDEAYYIGMADNPQCREKEAADKYGSRGKLLADFVTKTATYLHDRGRKVVFWGEFPLKLDDLSSLPKFLINGEVYGPEFDTVYRRLGIRQMIYTATQGEEQIFPNYFALPEGRSLHPINQQPGRAQETFEKVSFDQARGVADVMGMFVAGWADAGQHPENFWLGYAAGTSAGWHPGTPDARELMSSFYTLFYGPEVMNVDRVYQLLSWQAQFWNDSWERVRTDSRKPIWGYSEGIYNPRRPARDFSLSLPSRPAADLTRDKSWKEANSRRLQLASSFLAESDELIGLLHANMQKATDNRYSLEILLSNALLCRQNLDFLLQLGKIDQELERANTQAQAKNPKRAVAIVDQALNLLLVARDSRNAVLNTVTDSWMKTWYPRVSEANGRKFLHEVDDVKDHVPDRTVGMSYLVQRQTALPVEAWIKDTLLSRNSYAASNNLPTRKLEVKWNDLSVHNQLVTTAPTLE